MKDVFVLQKSKQKFETRSGRAEHNGVDTLSFLGPSIWATVPFRHLEPHISPENKIFN